MAMHHGRLLVLLLATQISTTVAAQTTQRISLDSSGGQANGSSTLPALSADGRVVAFESAATNLVPGDTNPYVDIFVRDRSLGTTERVSISSTGLQANAESREPSISADGRYVAFWSRAGNLVPTSTYQRQVYVHDRTSHTTELVSVSSAGVSANATSIYPDISADGRFVVFGSGGSNLVPRDTNGVTDVFLRDRQTGTTERVSVSSSGEQANRSALFPKVSADGRFVAFVSSANNLVTFTNSQHVYVRDRLSGTTEIATLNSSGALAQNGGSLAAISADGRFVAFGSPTSNLHWPPSPYAQLFVRDRQNGTTEIASVGTDGSVANGYLGRASLSADARYLVFGSAGANLDPADTNSRYDVFCRDRHTARTDRMSVDSLAGEANGDSAAAAISGSARFVAFASTATNLVPGDTNGVADIFVHERAATGVFSLCDPGVDGVVGCPCANPPAAPERGCDNSASTGGAAMVVHGFSSVSADGLTFETSGEKPAALSILLQGDSVLPMGAVYGQGVRCAGGSLKRLYVKTATGGTIVAPDPTSDEPTVSERSAELGAPIQPADQRWYLVYYRDPVVLGACLSTSTFNATQTLQVGWSL